MTRWLSVSAVLLGSVAALAQQPGLPQPAAPVPAQAPLLDPVNNKVDAILVNWEKAMNNLNTLHTAVNRTAVDKVFLAKEVFAGEAKYVRPNKASLLLFNQDPKKKSEFEKLVCNGTVAYKWEPLKNEIHVYELPKAKPGQVSDDNFVSMLFGMKASEAKRRYEMPEDQLRSDPNYYYIMVYPRDPQDKAEFTRARLALAIKTLLPCQIWFEQPNGNETTWDFPKMDANVQVNLAEFDQPAPPAGWQLRKIPMTDGPRVVRPQDGK